jgi:clan AA aspartic protease (TIGR02281 family)
MQRLWSVTIVYVLMALCCFSQPASESQADHRIFPEGAVAEAAAAAEASPITAGIRLAQSGNRGEAAGGSETWKRMGETVVSGGDEPTKVQIRGNSVLVPVTLVYGRNEADVHLLLDTGAAATTIHTEVADRLSLDLNRARKARVQVVGGGVIEASVIRIDSLTVGPHTKRNWNIFVVPHKGSTARYDGLLGMDVLRGLKYRVDFKKQVIVWD